MRRLDKKCIFGPPEGPCRRLCISRLFSTLFSLPVIKSRGGRCINISYSKYSPYELFSVYCCLNLRLEEKRISARIIRLLTENLYNIIVR